MPAKKTAAALAAISNAGRVAPPASSLVHAASAVTPGVSGTVNLRENLPGGGRIIREIFQG